MRQATLVALYGEKPEGLSKVISTCWDRLSNAFGGEFRPHDMAQIHATIIGLERVIGTSGSNLNALRREGRRVKMDIPGFLRWLTAPNRSGLVPFSVQICGFADREYPFRCLDKTPYKMTFSFQDGNPVLIGWPVSGNLPPDDALRSTGTPISSESYPKTLQRIRESAEAYGLYHKYLGDNDFFIRLGSLPESEADERNTTETELRALLGKCAPVVLEVGTDRVAIVSYPYGSETLPLATCEAWLLDDIDASEGLPAIYA